jgi:hypothetical protein
MYIRRDHENREESGIEKKYQKPEPKQLIAYRRLHVTLHRDRDFSKGKGRGRGCPPTSDIQHQRFSIITTITRHATSHHASHAFAPDKHQNFNLYLSSPAADSRQLFLIRFMMCSRFLPCLISDEK